MCVQGRGDTRPDVFGEQERPVPGVERARAETQQWVTGKTRGLVGHVRVLSVILGVAGATVRCAAEGGQVMGREMEDRARTAVRGHRRKTQLQGIFIYSDFEQF